MRRVVLVGAGVVLVLAGVIFTLQGVGVLGGSVMSGVTFWAVAGPVIALAGLALAAIGLRDRTDSRPRLLASCRTGGRRRERGTRVAALPSWSPLDHLASGLRVLPIAS
jgi:hypothetical protein